jgi:cytochrome b6-f complex iron-sulfur subunit
LVADDPQGGFACPCHGSKYSRDGSVLRGPAPRSLQLARLEIAADGKLQMGAWLEADFRAS